MIRYGPTVIPLNHLVHVAGAYDPRRRLCAGTTPGGPLKREDVYVKDIPLAVIQ